MFHSRLGNDGGRGSWRSAPSGQQQAFQGPRVVQPCGNGLGCTDPNCRCTHPAGWARPRRPNVTECRFKLACTRADCRYSHPSGWDPSRPVRVRVTQCKNGLDCTRADCHFSHPPGWERPSASAAPEPQLIQCRNGMGCTRADCHFLHPAGWNLEKLISVSSDRCGKSLVNKLSTYHGDNLEGLQTTIGAPVTYSEEQNCLMAQLPESKAFAGRRKLNEELETARKRVAGEWNELSIVGTTRITVGQGGALRTVLTGNQCISLVAKDVNPATGGNAAMRKQIADVLKVFDDKVVVTKLGRGADWKITFQSVEMAERALAAYPSGPWKILKPEIQTPRAATLVQICNVIVKYPLTVQLAKERRVILKEMLEAQGVRMPDVYVPKGDRATATGRAVIRMPTPTDVAMAVRRFNNRPYPELSGRTPLIVESDISFSATVTKTVFDALWQQLYKEKETAQQKGVTVTLEPPPEGAFRAEVKIRAAGQAVTAAHKNDIKATRARIEKLLHGRVLNFDREVLHLLANKEGREQLDKLMAECKEELSVPPGAPADMPRIKCLAVVCEKESSQVRLFGPSLWMDEATGLIDGLAMSHIDEQISYMSISGTAVGFLSRPDQQSRLDRIKADAGAESCQMSRAHSGGGRSQIALKGTPKSIKDARLHVKHLEYDARAGSSITIAAGQHGPAALACPVCFCDTEEADAYILEPCGHAYCKDCAPQLMKSGDLPIKCCKEGCDTPVCMEDIKIGISSGPGEYDAALQRAFNNFINENHDTFGRCYSADCKQVFKRGPSMLRFDCDHCMESFCTECRVSWHEGATCAEFQAKLKQNSESEAWKNENTRPCPKCSAPFYKDGGCNRVQCASCKTYICNLCLESFATSGDCYRHLSANHGGYYD